MIKNKMIKMRVGSLLVKCLLSLGFLVIVVNCGYDVPDDKLLFPNLPNAAPRSENTVCKEHSQLYIESLKNFSLWAHQILDATAKSSSSVLTGSLFQFGGWEECLNVQAPFKTQYCLATLKMDNIPEYFKPSDPFSLKFNRSDSVLRKVFRSEDLSKQYRDEIKLGWCIPASCTPIDLEKSLDHYIASAGHPFQDLNITYTAKVLPQLCQTESELYNFEVADIIFCLLLAILVLTAIICTICDFRSLDKPLADKEKPVKKTSKSFIICKAFSLRENFIDLGKSENAKPALSIFYGVRTLCIFVIIMDHRFGTYLSGPLNNFDWIEKEYRSFSSLFIFHGDLFVDTFFILSGMLVAYGLLSQLEKRAINPGFLIFMRYIRLTPLLAFCVFFYATMFNHMGAGPLWKLIVTPESVDCRNNWWTNLLYLSNYIDEANMCMVHTWYLACDFHYFIIGIFLVMLIDRNRKIGLTVLALLFLLSIAIPFLITLVYLRPALVRFYPLTLMGPKKDLDFQMTYIRSHTRATSYFVGIFFGYIYYKLKGDENYTISKLKSHLLTFVSLVLMFLGMTTGAIFYNPYQPYNAISSSVYAALHRPAWSIGSCGIFFAASYGHALLIRRFLAWSVWIPLSKLVYGAYLCHMVFQLRSLATVTSTRHFSYIDVIQLTFGDWVAAFSTALVLYLLIEAPVKSLFKELLMSRKPKRDEDVNTETQNHIANNNSTNCDSRV